MRILFILDIGLDRPGPSVHLLESVITDSIKRNHFVDVILKKTKAEGPIVPEDLSASRNFNYKSIDDIEKKKKGFIGRYIDEIRYAFKCRRHYRKEKYDVVFLQSCNTAIFHIVGLKKLNCPIVFNVQDIFPYNLMLSNQLPLNKITFPILRKLQNMAYTKSDKIITISEDMKDTLVKDRVDRDKISVIYNWSYSDAEISIDKIKRENIYDLNADEKKYNVVYAGNIGRMQNVEIIASAAEKLVDREDIHFYIIGDGANKSIIDDIAGQLPNVTLLPMQESKYAESIYAQADVNIIPLAPGVVYTALPSKTATCLRVNKPIVFCIDQESKFFKYANENLGMTIGPCDVEGLSRCIIDSIEQKGKLINNRNRSLFTKENSKRYVDIFEQTSVK